MSWRRLTYGIMNSNSWYNDFFFPRDAMHSAVLTRQSRALVMTLSMLRRVRNNCRRYYYYYRYYYQNSVSLYVRLSVSVCDALQLPAPCSHIGWNTSKIISRPNSLRLMHWLTSTWAIWCNGNTYPTCRMYMSVAICAEKWMTSQMTGGRGNEKRKVRGDTGNSGKGGNPVLTMVRRDLTREMSTPHTAPYRTYRHLVG